MPILDRARTSQDQHIRWDPTRVPLPCQELPGGRAVENEGIKITVVGALAIAGVVLLLVLLVRFLREKQQQNGSNP